LAQNSFASSHGLPGKNALISRDPINMSGDARRRIDGGKPSSGWVMAKRKQTWLRASTHRRQRSAGWRAPCTSRKAWSPREGRPMKEPKVPPGYPPCSLASVKLRSPVSAFFRKITESPTGNGGGTLASSKR
jgi:hypothetical protein